MPEPISLLLKIIVCKIIRENRKRARLITFPL